MFKPAARFFANLAVGKKLLIGFGLVLLLTAAMTVSGYLAVQAVLHGHEQVGELAQVNQEILQARRLERNFAIEQSPESAQRVRESLLKVQDMVEQLGSDAAEGARVQTMQQAAAEYLKQFDNYVEQQDKAREARQDMRSAAAEARDQFRQQTLLRRTRMALAGHQHMAGVDLAQVHESQGLRVFKNDGGGDFLGHQLAKNAAAGRRMVDEHGHVGVLLGGMEEVLNQPGFCTP